MSADELTHVPMAVTAEGEGPAEGQDAHHLVCWCQEPACVWNKALVRARVLELRAAADEAYGEMGWYAQRVLEDRAAILERELSAA